MRMTRAELRRIRAATDITGEMHPVADRLMLVAWSLSVGLAQGYRLHLLHDCSRCADQPNARRAGIAHVRLVQQRARPS
jgi:hypothetical protein